LSTAESIFQILSKLFYLSPSPPPLPQRTGGRTTTGMNGGNPGQGGGGGGRAPEFDDNSPVPNKER
jgi:hypothetical protein